MTNYQNLFFGLIGTDLRGLLIIILVFVSSSRVTIDCNSTGEYFISRFDNAEGLPKLLLPSSHESPVGSKVCRIPELDVLNQATKRYMFNVSAIHCKTGGDLHLVNSNLTMLYIDPKARARYNDSAQVNCCWQIFERTKHKDNDIRFRGKCHKFKDSARMGDEFVKVECRRIGVKIYEDYHAFVPRKPMVEKRCRNALRPNNQRLNVLIHCLDAVSRLNFHRTMPETLKILRDLEAVEMLGYNTVGDNSFQNAIPLLSGMSIEELKISCSYKRPMIFDACPLIWKNFSAAGYRTVLSEDRHSLSIFNYLESGFREPPTDYYLRPYFFASERNIGNTNDHCIGSRKAFEILIDYSKKFALEFANDAYFGLFWQTSLTHDYLNYPRLGDRAYGNFLRHMIDNGLLNNTALIMMSDHGMRYGKYLQLEQGRLERSLPSFFIVLPTWWRYKFKTAWANLQKNSRSLITAFDLHETLMDLSKTEELQEDALKNRTSAPNSDKAQRGISLFLPYPDNRTCSMAGIASHFCTCSERKKISLKKLAVLQTVQFVLTWLNNMLKSYPQCANLTLKSVLGAEEWSDKSMADYTVRIRTSPGDALLEATVHHINESSKRLAGPISRLNLYGEQSICVTNPTIRLYCYCR